MSKNPGFVKLSVLNRSVKDFLWPYHVTVLRMLAKTHAAPTTQRLLAMLLAALIAADNVLLTEYALTVGSMMAAL